VQRQTDRAFNKPVYTADAFDTNDPGEYFSTESIEAAWFRASIKSPCGNTDILPLVVYYRLGYDGKCYFKKTSFHDVAVKQYIHTKS